MSEVGSFLQGIPWFAWIPILAIVLGISSGTITRLIEMRHRHTERMAMIRAGMHPDAPTTSSAEYDSAPSCCEKPVGVNEI
jgi:hypothetical protein